MLLKKDAKQLLKDRIKAMNVSGFSSQLNELEDLSQSPDNWEIAIAKATELIAAIYLNIEPALDKISAFENYNHLVQQKGRVTEHVHLYLVNNYSLSYVSYIEKIITLIINDHIATAYRKMGNGEANLLKFMVEDNVIGHIQTMSPKFTNPRIQTLRNFLADMHFIDEEGLLMKSGIELLKKIAS